jgi:aminopeptidase N
MGTNRDSRAWKQIVEALGTIEYDERGTPGHDAFAAFARSIIKPIVNQLGWDAQATEPPDVQELRRALLTDLGVWGDQDTLEEARRRFTGFLKDRRSLVPDDQTMVFSIVARNADGPTFEQLHAVAKAATDDAARDRYYTALMSVRNPQLAAQAAQIALSPELPPQAAMTRVGLVLHLVGEHHQLSWSTFTEHVDTLLAPYPSDAPLIIAQYIPSTYWDSAPLDQLEAWVRAHVPAQMSSNVERGLETARFKLSEKEALTAAADAYLHSSRLKAGS